MNAGMVASIIFPQNDGELKYRPGILIKRIPPFRDWLCCPVSTQLRHAVHGLDLVIDERHADYRLMGLRSVSIIRAGQLHAVPEADIRGIIGRTSAATFDELIGQLVAWLQQPQPSA